MPPERHSGRGQVHELRGPAGAIDGRDRFVAELAALIIVGAARAFRVVAEHDERRHVTEGFRHLIGRLAPWRPPDGRDSFHLGANRASVLNE
jgi:hypothetical protein